VGVIIVAAGKGSRMGAELPKQYRPVAGVPMVLRALRPFTVHPDVAQIVLVLPPADADRPPAFLAGLPGGVLTLVAGGAERGESVAAGLAGLRPECGIVLVHDAARPFVDRTVIDAVIAVARGGEGAVPGVPVRDTLKEVSSTDSARVGRTLPREGLWRAQTPQAFPRAMLLRAYARAAGEGHRATDDAALVEAGGEPVRLVPDSPHNIKITTPEDAALAELLAGLRP
jgi:2-C-methyl-D-erythritol 4-phosphate cytidylyltransferase